MTPEQIAANNRLNSFLKKSCALELVIEKDNPELASLIRQTTSKVAVGFMKVHGLDIAIKQFYQEQKGLAHETL